MKINGNTKIIGFLGSTYKTSKMYALYNSAFENLDLNFAYIPLIVENLEKAIIGIRNLGIHAVGVTIPYKESVIPYLDGLDQNARTIGAVNTIVNKNGRLVGFNTDGKGAVMALKEKTSIANKKIILLGAGGAAKAIAHEIIKEKGKLIVFNRHLEPILKLKKQLSILGYLLSELPNHINDAYIIINATSVGMFPKIEECLVTEDQLNSRMIVMDLITNPKETTFISKGLKKGCKIIYGERMLLWQAVLKFELFTGIKPPIKTMQEAFYA